MNVDSKTLDRFNELLDLGEQVLLTKYSVPLGDFGIHNQVDETVSYEWAMKCLNTLEAVFGKGSLHYIEFEDLFRGFTSIEGYSCTKRAFSILKAAKEDYENEHIVKQTREAKIQVEGLSVTTKNVVDVCEVEARRNTRFYLAIIFVFLAVISIILIYFFELTVSLILTIGVFISSYFLSALTLKEWNLTKLPERLLEIEIKRINKRFGVKE